MQDSITSRSIIWERNVLNMDNKNILPIAGELPKQFKTTTSSDSQFYI